MVYKVTFVGFRGGIAPISSPCIRPWSKPHFGSAQPVRSI